MARTITIIHKEILDDIAANEALSDVLTSTSIYAVFRAFSYVIASAIFLLEKMFDQHIIETNTIIFNQKSGRKSWYKFMALQFQYGFDLVEDKDYYDNNGVDESLVLSSKIIKYAAVDEAQESSRVIIKVAREINGVLSPLTQDQYDAFVYYINEIRWAGTEISIINYLADQLYLNIQVKRDALVLDQNGMSILNGNYPINDAILEFMKELPFDGDLRLSGLVDKLQVISGVIDVTVLSAESSWINPTTGGYGVPQPIFISKKAESGYFEVVNFDNIAYVV